MAHSVQNGEFNISGNEDKFDDTAQDNRQENGLKAAWDSVVKVNMEGMSMEEIMDFYTQWIKTYDQVGHNLLLYNDTYSSSLIQIFN